MPFDHHNLSVLQEQARSVDPRRPLDLQQVQQHRWCLRHSRRLLEVTAVAAKFDPRILLAGLSISPGTAEMYWDVRRQIEFSELTEHLQADLLRSATVVRHGLPR